MNGEPPTQWASPRGRAVCAVQLCALCASTEAGAMWEPTRAAEDNKSGAPEYPSRQSLLAACALLSSCPLPAPSSLPSTSLIRICTALHCTALRTTSTHNAPAAHLCSLISSTLRSISPSFSIPPSSSGVSRQAPPLILFSFARLCPATYPFPSLSGPPARSRPLLSSSSLSLSTASASSVDANPAMPTIPSARLSKSARLTLTSGPAAAPRRAARRPTPWWLLRRQPESDEEEEDDPTAAAPQDTADDDEGNVSLT